MCSPGYHFMLLIQSWRQVIDGISFFMLLILCHLLVHDSLRDNILNFIETYAFPCSLDSLLKNTIVSL